MKSLRWLVVGLTLMSFMALQGNDEILKKIPKDCNLLMVIKVGEIINAPFFKTLIEMNKEKIKEKNVDLDMVKTMVVGTIYNEEAMKNPSADKQKFFGIIDTNKPIKLEEFIAKEFKDREVKKATLLDKVYFEATQDGVAVGAYQVSDTQILVGTLDLLHKGIMLDKGMGESALSNATLKKLVKFDKGMITAGGIMDGSPDFNGFSLMMDYQKGLKINCGVFCKKEEKAAEIVMQMGMMLPMLTSNPELGLKADSFKVVQNAKAANIDAFIPEEVLLKLPAMMMQMFMKNAAPADQPPQQ